MTDGGGSGTMTAEDVRAALGERFSDRRRYVVVEEVGDATGLAKRRQIDMIVLDCRESSAYRMDAFEVKVSRADLRRELEHPEKHAAFKDAVDGYWIACPKGMVDKSALPREWGLMTVDGDGSTRIARRALPLQDEAARPVPRALVASLCRKAARDSVAAAQLERAREEGRGEVHRELDWQLEDLRRRLGQSEGYTRAVRELAERLDVPSLVEADAGGFRLDGSAVEGKLAAWESFCRLYGKSGAWLATRMEGASRDLADIAAGPRAAPHSAPGGAGRGARRGPGRAACRMPVDVQYELRRMSTAI